MNETFYLDLNGERVYPRSLALESEAGKDHPYEYTVLAGDLTSTAETGDDFAIAFIDGTTHPQRVERAQPIDDYPLPTEDDDQLICVSWRESEQARRIYTFTPTSAQLTFDHAGQTTTQEIDASHVTHQQGDIIIWMGKGVLYDICRQKPFETGDLTNLDPSVDTLPAPFIEAVKASAPTHSHILTLLN